MVSAMRNIVDEIEARADRRAVALIEGGRALTFGDLLELTEAAAAALSVQPGQRIGLNCPNGTAHIVWSLAVLRRGGVLVPVAPELSPRERDEQARTTGLHAILSADGKSWHRETPERFSLNVDGLGEAVLQAGLGTDGPPDFDEATLSALNPALIRFSSGTTGRRKGVVLSHRTLFDRVTASNARLGIGPGDRVIWTLPMAHHFAVSIVLYLLHGATTVIENSHLGADVHRALVRNRGTVLYASPFHHSLLAGCAEAAPVPSLRLAVSTAAALPEATARQFREKLGIPLCQALGIIECGLPILNDAWPQEKPLAIGRPQPAYSVSLRNAGGKEVADGETGALSSRGRVLSMPISHRGRPRGRSWRTGGSARETRPIAMPGAAFSWLDGRIPRSMSVG